MSALEEFAKAIWNDDSATVESLISRGSVDVNARLPRFLAPPALVYAAECGRTEIVDILLQANARVDEVDERRQTACHAAAASGHCDVLALLLARRPNLDVVTTVNRKTAFCCAASSSETHAWRCALMLLEAGASLERADPSDVCRFAATSTTVIQALINHGVAVRELRDFLDGTALHAAAGRCRDANVLDMLVNVCRIDLHARDRDGATCFHFAASRGNVFALRWFLSAGADPDCVSSNGSTPLHNVIHHSCAVVLLGAGASVCARDNKGRTALHRVAARLRSELTTVYPLLAAGADLDAVDDAGETARDVSARVRLTVDAELLEAARRDIAKARIDFVRYRALEVCIGLQPLELDALQMCEILQFACGKFAPLIPFHIWWKIGTTVKHFRSK
jgi:ankyrin repeat protein